MAIKEKTGMQNTWVMIINDPKYEEDWSVMVLCDYCPFCNMKASANGPIELHIGSDRSSVVFHDIVGDPSSICEMPDSHMS